MEDKALAARVRRAAEREGYRLIKNSHGPYEDSLGAYYLADERNHIAGPGWCNSLDDYAKLFGISAN